MGRSLKTARENQRQASRVCTHRLPPGINPTPPHRAGPAAVLTHCCVTGLLSPGNTLLPPTSHPTRRPRLACCWNLLQCSYWLRFDRRAQCSTVHLSTFQISHRAVVCSFRNVTHKSMQSEQPWEAPQLGSAGPRRLAPLCVPPALRAEAMRAALTANEEW